MQRIPWRPRPPPPRPPEPKPFASVPQLAPLLGLSVLACYLSGFLTVNTYLARFGIFDTDPLKAAYLTVGATFFAISGMYFYAAGSVLVRWGHFERNFQRAQQQAGLSGPLWAS